MGAVYKARQRELDRLVALKILPPAIGDVPGFAERFSREAKALAKLNHPGIVTIHDTGRVEGLYFLVMEFMDGPNLRQLLEERSILPEEALAIVLTICDALQVAHEMGIVHRDIKPENILIDRNGRIKVADFGLAKWVGTEEMDSNESGDAAFGVTEAGHLMGTPHYMAPEQILEPVDVDHRADIYSLGVVLYQMLTGELPAPVVAPPSQKVPVDARLDAVVMRALEKNPQRRFRRIEEFKEGLEAVGKSSSGGWKERTPEMEIKFTCPNCDQKLSVEESEAGTEAICPSCSHPLLVPMVAARPSPPPVYESVNPFASRPSPDSGPAMATRARTLAIWSLVLGLIGLVPVLGLGTGALGLLLGIIALFKGTTSKGMAITGLIAGGISLLAIPVHLWIFNTSMTAAKFATRTIECATNLNAIGNGIAEYRKKHDGKNPPSLDALVGEGLLEESQMGCPEAGGVQRYIYTGNPALALLAWDRIPHRGPGDKVLGRNVLDANLSVRFLTEEQFKTENKGAARPAENAPAPSPTITHRPPKNPTSPSPPKAIPPPAISVDIVVEKLPSTAPRDQRPLLRFLAEAEPTPEKRTAVIGVLKPLLNDMENGDSAFQAFANWADKEQVPELIEILRVAPGSSRGKQSMQMLSRMGDARAAEPLAACLSEFPVARDAKAALVSLGDIAKPVVLPMFHHEDGNVREVARELLRGYKATDEEILEASIKALAREEREVRRSALAYLSTAKLSPEKRVVVARAARPLLNDPEARVRDAAREAMKVLATKADADFLLGLMASTDEPTRAFATDLLVQFKDARAAKPLAMLLSDAHKTYWAGDKLIQIGSTTEPAIIPYLASEDPGTRQRAADILAKIGTPASLRALGVVAEKDKNFFAKVAATNAINAIKGRNSGNQR